MFQLGSLVVLCSLLTGTSELPFSNIGSSLNNLYNLDSISEEVLNNLKSEYGLLWTIPKWPVDDRNRLGAVNIPDIGRLNLHSSKDEIRFEINKLRILDILVSLSSNRKSIDLKLPLIVIASVSMPLIGTTANISISVDFITSLTVQTDAQTGLPTLAIRKCSSVADQISISLLDRENIQIQRAVDSVSNLLKKIVSLVIKNQVCPLFQFLLSNMNSTHVLTMLCKSQYVTGVYSLGQTNRDLVSWTRLVHNGFILLPMAVCL